MKTRNFIIVFLSIVLCLIVSACGGKSSDHEGKYINQMMNSSITLKSSGEFEWDLMVKITGKYSISGTNITFQVTGDKEKAKGTIKDDVIDFQGIEYTRERSYMVVFDTDGGTPILTQVIKKGEKAIKPGTPIKDDNYFVNWFQDKKKTQPYDFNAEINSNLTLYASWSTECRIAFDKTEGSGGTNNVNVYYGYNMPSATAPVSLKENYLFAGYYDDKQGGNKYYNADMSSARIWDRHEWATLYARWIIEGALFTVYFDHQSGVSSVYSIDAKFGEIMPNINAPIKFGADFLGYYDAVENGTKYYNSDMTSARNWDIANDATLYARWKISTSYIIFDDQGGTGGSYSVDATYGEAMPIATAPIKTGFEFLGYYDDKQGGNKYYNADMSSARNWDKITDSKLYARWKGLECNIIFEKQNGVGGTDNVIVEYGQQMPSAIAPSKDGYAFLGYFDALEGGIQYYDKNMSSMRIWDKQINTTLYAHWVEQPYYTDGLVFDCGETTCGVFGYSGSDERVVIPNMYLGKPITFIDDTSFYYNSDIKQIIIPSSIIWIGYMAFAYCVNLDSIIIPSSVTSIEPTAFVGTGIWNNTPNNNVVYADNWAIGYKGSGYYVSSLDFKEGTRVIGDAFDAYSFENVTTITIPKSVVIIKSYAFSGFSGLTSVRFEEGSQLTTIGYYAFGGCRSLPSIAIPDNVTTISDSAFMGCSNLTTVTIPSSVISIGNYAFSSCTSLTSITIPSSVISIGSQVFSYCNSLSIINVDSNNTAYKSINGDLYSKDGKILIRVAPSKTFFIIPSSVTKIDEGAFNYCINLTSIVIPDSVTTISNGAFMFCGGLTTVTIPSSVTSIEDNAFLGCTNLTSITIPSSVMQIGMYIFSSCGSLTTIYVQGHESKPDGWSYDWNYNCSAEVIWNA